MNEETLDWSEDEQRISNDLFRFLTSASTWEHSETAAPSLIRSMGPGVEMPGC